MKNILLMGTMLGGALILAACTGQKDHKSQKGSEANELPHFKKHQEMAIASPNSIDSNDVKDAAINPACFYGDNPPPISTSTATNDAYLDLQYVAFRVLPNGNTERLIANRGTESRLQAAEDNNDFLGWIDILSNANGFVPFPADQAVINLGERLIRNPDQLDLKLNWYTKLAFIVIGPDVKFDVNNPFQVASGGERSPFYSPFNFYKNDQMFTVDYLSLPNNGDYGFDVIVPRDCIYQYELTLTSDRVAQARGQNRTFTSKIIIDPGTGNSGPPDDDEPLTFP